MRKYINLAIKKLKLKKLPSLRLYRFREGYPHRGGFIPDADIIAINCANPDKLKTFLHELGHATGLWHRLDRKQIKDRLELLTEYNKTGKIAKFFIQEEVYAELASLVFLSKLNALHAGQIKSSKLFILSFLNQRKIGKIDWKYIKKMANVFSKLDYIKDIQKVKAIFKSEIYN